MKTKIISAILTLIITAAPLFRTSALEYTGSCIYMSGKYYKQLYAVKLTDNKRLNIVSIAKTQIGYQEGGEENQLSGILYGCGNYTEYGRWYGMQDMWCAIFVSWCASTAGIPSSVIPKHSYTPTGLAWFINSGRAYSRAAVSSGVYTPQSGDIIYFKSRRNNNTTNHVGIITDYSHGIIYTVEGNARSVCGGSVVSKSYSAHDKYIVYICSPAYAN